MQRLKKWLLLLFSSIPILLIALFGIIIALFFVENLWFWKIATFLLIIGLLLVNYNLNYSSLEKWAKTRRAKERIREDH